MVASTTALKMEKGRVLAEQGGHERCYLASAGSDAGWTQQTDRPGSISNIRATINRSGRDDEVDRELVRHSLAHHHKWSVTHRHEL